MTQGQIAEHLVIRNKTVKARVRNSFRQLDVTNRLDAVAAAVRAWFVHLSAQQPSPGCPT